MQYSIKKGVRSLIICYVQYVELKKSLNAGTQSYMTMDCRWKNEQW